MIRCYYSKKALLWAKWNWLFMLVSFCFLVYSWMVPITVAALMSTTTHPGMKVILVIGIGTLIGATFVIQWFHRRVDKTTLQNAGDEITLDDEEIRLMKADGTQITLSRKELKVRCDMLCMTGHNIFVVSSLRFAPLRFVPGSEIMLTSDMENARELIEAIQPGSWDRAMKGDSS